MSDWLSESIFLMPNYKWLGIGVAIICTILLRTVLRQALTSVKSSNRIRARLHGFLLALIDQPIERPIAWIFSILFFLICLDTLGVVAGLDKYLRIFAQLLLAYNIVRIAYLAIEAINKVLLDFAKNTENTLDDQLVPFATKTLKLLVIIMGFLIVLQNFGVNVMSLIAGLGLGGLALALAAQDTAANLFGSITILLDRPFQIGDWIKVGDTEGHVEEVGFRSTRVRTFYNSLISIPNSTMAKEKIDNMGARPTRRVRHTLGLTYGTSEETIRQFTEQIKLLLAKNPLIIHENATVALRELGDFSLHILLNYFVQVKETNQEVEIQQEVLFEVMRIAKNLKVDFAFPTETHYLKSLD